MPRTLLLRSGAACGRHFADGAADGKVHIMDAGLKHSIEPSGGAEAPIGRREMAARRA